MPVFIDYLRMRGLARDEVVVISPDAGGVERARAFAKRIESTMAIIDKRRPQPNVSEVMNIIGDVKGKHAVIIDDMIDTAGTVTQAAKVILDRGAKSVMACVTHGVLSGPAIQRINDSVLSDVIITDTIPLSAAARACPKTASDNDSGSAPSTARCPARPRPIMASTVVLTGFSGARMDDHDGEGKS
jgi:ribose-phosphate pyrophosphokinase